MDVLGGSVFLGPPVAADLELLLDRRYDLVIDACGYLPGEVSRSAELLEPCADHYAFVSKT